MAKTFSAFEVQLLQKVQAIAECNRLDFSLLTLKKTGLYTDIQYGTQTMLRFKLEGSPIYWLVYMPREQFGNRFKTSLPYTEPSLAEGPSKTRLLISSPEDLDAFEQYIVQQYEVCTKKPYLETPKSNSEAYEIKQMGTSNRSVQRPQKGRSLRVLTDTYIALDLETTGLNPSTSEIIEIGAIRYENGERVDFFQTFVNPRILISPFITKLTGITNEMVSDAQTIDVILPRLLSYIGNSVLVGHNVNFDVNFLYDNCIRHLNIPFTNDFIDTMILSRKFFKSFENHKLVTLANNFKICETTEHRALSDAEVTASCYEHIKKEARRQRDNA